MPAYSACDFVWQPFDTQRLQTRILSYNFYKPVGINFTMICVGTDFFPIFFKMEKNEATFKIKY